MSADFPSNASHSEHNGTWHPPLTQPTEGEKALLQKDVSEAGKNL
jgi:hypothetical protein